MEVNVLRETFRPERLICQHARNDYTKNYVGHTEYADLMEPVDYDEEWAEQRAEELLETTGNVLDYFGEDAAMKQAILDAKTRHLLHKEYSRGHWGIAEHPQISFAIKGASRVTMAQITRHRHISFDIQSMRYADFEEQEIVTPAALLSDEERMEEYPAVFSDSPDYFTQHEGKVEVENRESWKNRYEAAVEELRQLYLEMVDDGVPKQDARYILPLGTTANITMSGNVRTFMHLFNLREKQDAQWEIRQLSALLLEKLREWVPLTAEWWDEHKPLPLSP